MARKVFVGMSGGVDSSVAAALLVEQGYDVTGVYMKNWSRDLPGMKCPWREDMADAKRVAVQLGIDFEMWDFEEEYREKVVEYMVEEYRAGRTPNPDVMCNQEVKFGVFWRLAMEKGADFVATGHYARTLRESASNSSDPVYVNPREKNSVLTAEKLKTFPPSINGAYSENLECTGSDEVRKSLLLRAIDEKKDQTYFLYRVSGEVLVKTIFPLGGMMKSEVREMAKSRGLATAGRKESMGVCFVGNVGIREFLSEYVEKKFGEVRDVKTGEVVGEHDGAIFYTIGQRHGLGLGGGLPYYVTGKDMEENVVWVSRDLNERGLWRKEVQLTNVHWINPAINTGDLLSLAHVNHREENSILTAEKLKTFPPSINGVYSEDLECAELSQVSRDKVLVRVRHQAKLAVASLKENDRGAVVKFDEEQRAITAGQSVVFYDGEVCLGGGIVA